MSEQSGQALYMSEYKYVLHGSVVFSLRTGLMIRSGKPGKLTDSSIERSFDGKLHINGYVWSSLLRRALARLKGTEELVKAIGKDTTQTNQGVSPLWCEATSSELYGPDVRPGNKVSRVWGAVCIGAVFSDEIVPPGIPLACNFNYFARSEEEIKNFADQLCQALDVIRSGIENIGSGWSYGHGRLDFFNAISEILDLKKSSDRSKLWEFPKVATPEKPYRLACKKPEMAKPCTRYTVKARIADGQLLAVHTDMPMLDSLSQYGDKLPASFVYRRYKFNGQKLAPEIVIPGRTIRQALLSAPLERKLRSQGQKICEDTKPEECQCSRCQWFGNTDSGGMIAVLDAPVTNAAPQIVNRVQLCEHSLQNMNLFSGEYLKGGEFTIEILLDEARNPTQAAALKGALEALLNELKPSANTPPGWYRLGATATCTGQVEVTDWK
jgi:CRISPR/Cas system CSM-associated protein Csm3 (group 7 of RAMP superfamily)